MQDGKALQAGTSHYLGTHFAEAQNIQFQNARGPARVLPHHELGRVDAPDRRRDHDPRRRRRPAPAAEDRAAPDRHRADAARQARGRGAARLLRLAREGAEGSRHPRAGRCQARQVGREALELGAPRRAGDRRDRRARCRRRQRHATCAATRCATATRSSRIRARARSSWPRRRRFWKTFRRGSLPRPRRASTATSSRGIKTFDELAEYFGAAAAEDEGGAFKGWARVAWSKPEGAELEAIGERLKALKLTIRNAPLDQEAGPGRMPVHGGSGPGVRADRARLLRPER